MIFMDNLYSHQHISNQFNTELENLRNKVLNMGGLVEQQIRDAVDALLVQDADSGDKVIRQDHRVNAMEVAIDEECTRILARRQPAASDLRMIIAVIKTITDLERMGDEAEKIGRMAVFMSENDSRFSSRYAGIKPIAESVGRMTRNALDAFARLDVDLALEVVRSDEEVDEEYKLILRQLITYMMEDPKSISEILNIVWTARALERIGDHAKNIGEYVIYLVMGKDIRHINIDEIEEKLF